MVIMTIRLSYVTKIVKTTDSQIEFHLLGAKDLGISLMHVSLVNMNHD